MEKEFNEGETVHFQPFVSNKPIECKVISIYQGFHKNGIGFNGEPDNRFFYRLEGINKPCLSECTGKSILESTLFNPSTDF